MNISNLLNLQFGKDEHTFFTITFMKFKLRNCLTTDLDLVVRMYV